MGKEPDWRGRGRVGPPEERSFRDHLRRGVVLLDKPSGPTSRQAADRVRQLLGASKVGHGGTLDPGVSGLLPVLLDRSTLIARLLLGCRKVYQGTMHLHAQVGSEELERAVAGCVGEIEQVPPRRSRVKRRPRRRRIYAFEVTGRKGRNARFRVVCEGGTYVRKLVHDMGRELGCGAHMSELRRLWAGPFAVEEGIALTELQEARGAAEQGREGPLWKAVLALEDVVSRLIPRVWADKGALPSLSTGYPLAVPGVLKTEAFGEGDMVAVMSPRGEMIALGEAEMNSETIEEVNRGRAVAMRRVLIQPDTCPKSSTEKDYEGHSDR